MDRVCSIVPNDRHPFVFLILHLTQGFSQLYLANYITEKKEKVRVVTDTFSLFSLSFIFFTQSLLGLFGKTTTLLSFA